MTHKKSPRYTSIEICAGAGGQAVGLHQAGFDHLALVEIDKYAIETLELNIKTNRALGWKPDNCAILPIDVNEFNPLQPMSEGAKRLEPRELDLLAGGVPCPPFSHAGKQLGKDDERDLFPRMLELVEILQPRAVMIENVRGIMDPKFSEYRSWIKTRLERGDRRQAGGEELAAKGPGYTISQWGVLEASNFGVPQLRPRAILVAFRNDVIQGLNGNEKYIWPGSARKKQVTVAESLKKSMQERYSRYSQGEHKERADLAYKTWLEKASGIAPTLVGGSKKHGGADLGPSRAKAAWRQLGVSGMGVANDIETCLQKHTEDRDLFGPDGPMLTVQQAAIIQGFPSEWKFSGGKTAQYRQVGNAFPPPVAEAVGKSIIKVLEAARKREKLSNDAMRKRDIQSDQLQFDMPSEETQRAS
ncbi:DNA (cytosine-5-)-methyltransferase [Nocardia sp. NPDC052001]|uniref:DNA cytosine methyltransferase n=1 Tax=Nocardia sp. NPDC052001 TaxID=3154853 RepID=UPI00342237F1